MDFKINNLLEAIKKGPAIIQPLLPCAQYPSRKFGLGSFEDQLLMLMGRDIYVREHGLVLLSAECADALAALLRGKRVLEAGSGTGFVAHTLHERGVDVTALDKDDPRTGKHDYDFGKVWKLDLVQEFSPDIVKDFDVVMLIWPPHGADFSEKVAASLQPGQILIYEGEWGGCTGSDRFHQMLKGDEWHLMEKETTALNTVHAGFHTMKDYWYVFERK